MVKFYIGCESLGVKDQIEQEILYSGRVQGVGFRQSVCTLARKGHVNGYVQNLDNGKVRLVVGGECDRVNDLLKSVKSLWVNNISHIQIADLKTAENSIGFSVRC